MLMKNIPRQPDFSFSQTIYGRLLLAYPRSHRAKYGAAMAQLFRDQCRDAWNESQNWGVIKLWMRVLPDLVKTSFIERLAALNERKSMSDKMTALIQPRTIFLKVFAVVFLIILCATVAVTFLLPETYASVSRIKAEPDNTSNDPYFLQTTFEIIQSQNVLEPVIDKLHLNTVWSKKYNGGGPLETADTLKLLNERLSLTPVRNTKLINITVFSEDKNEAAQIANAIAQSYQNYRVKHRSALITQGIGILQAEYKQEEEQITAMQTSLDQLRRDLKIDDQDPKALTASSALLPQEQSYWDKKRDLAKIIEFHKLLQAKITSEKIDIQIPVTSMAEIVDTAKPGHAPVRPNKPLNIALGAGLGFLLALIIGGISALVALLIRKRTSNISSAA